MFYQTVTKIIILISLFNGIRSDFEDRIIGGQNVPISEHPYQISFQYLVQHICGGSIINNTIVVTAAHCVADMDSEDIPKLSVVAGTSTYASGGTRVPVKSFVVHQYFNKSGILEYDVAVILLKSRLNFNNLIQPISLAQKTPENGTSVYVSGWGMLNNNDPRSSLTLQGVALTFISRKACASPPNRYSPSLIDPSMICAAENGKAPCRGDSGGPLVDSAKKSLLGIVSWGFVCAAKNYPGVYASVPALRNWITSTADTLTKL